MIDANHYPWVLQLLPIVHSAAQCPPRALHSPIWCISRGRGGVFVACSHLTVALGKRVRLWMQPYEFSGSVSPMWFGLIEAGPADHDEHVWDIAREGCVRGHLERGKPLRPEYFLCIGHRTMNFAYVLLPVELFSPCKSIQTARFISVPSSNGGRLGMQPRLICFQIMCF